MEVSIRKWRIEDAEELSNAMNNKKILDNLRDGIPYPYTIEHAKEFIMKMLSVKTDSEYSWAIIVDNKVAGNIGAIRKSNIHSHTAEMGYYISEPHWGKGIMTNVVKEVCKYIFENTDIIRIFAEPFADNIASCKVLEKAGFELEGVLRKNAIKNGEILNTKIYSIINE
ncbi:MAG: GNAT family N-acetyltransferase [Oscillospiraceae bacterium]|nr:GNAT family N-acetyltransferase [Oscillospiraceae bacterium]